MRRYSRTVAIGVNRCFLSPDTTSVRFLALNWAGLKAFDQKAKKDIFSCCKFSWVWGFIYDGDGYLATNVIKNLCPWLYGLSRKNDDWGLGRLLKASADAWVWKQCLLTAFLSDCSVPFHRLGCWVLTCSSATRSGFGVVFWQAVWWSVVGAVTRAAWSFSGETMQHLCGTDLGDSTISTGSVEFGRHRFCPPPDSWTRVSELEAGDPENMALFPPGCHLFVFKSKLCLHVGMRIYFGVPKCRWSQRTASHQRGTSFSCVLRLSAGLSKAEMLLDVVKVLSLIFISWLTFGSG